MHCWKLQTIPVEEMYPSNLSPPSSHAWEEAPANAMYCCAKKGISYFLLSMQAASSEDVWQQHTAARWKAVGMFSPHSIARCHGSHFDTFCKSSGHAQDVSRQHKCSPPMHGGATSSISTQCNASSAQAISSDTNNMNGLDQQDIKQPHNRPARASASQYYISRHLAEMRLQCQHCTHGVIVPIVYGFPSSLLLKAGREKKAINGGDYLIAGEPVWACNACQASFCSFPYQSLFD